MLQIPYSSSVNVTTTKDKLQQEKEIPIEKMLRAVKIDTKHLSGSHLTVCAPRGLRQILFIFDIRTPDYFDRYVRQILHIEKCKKNEHRPVQ